jgi:aminopeptidase N
MSEELGALKVLVHHGLPGADQALAQFAERWQEEALVMDQWFAVQATVPGEQTVERVNGLLEHPAFDWKTPNRVRALVGTFTNGNPSAFHAENGAGYRLFAQALSRLDAINPQVAARLANGAARLPRLEPQRRERLAEVLSGVQKSASDNVVEVLGRILSS